MATQYSLNDSVGQTDMPESPLLALLRQVPRSRYSGKNNNFVFGGLVEDQNVPQHNDASLSEEPSKNMNSSNDNSFSVVPKTPNSSNKSNITRHQFFPCWYDFTENIPCSPSDGVVPNISTPLVTPSHTPILKISHNSILQSRLFLTEPPATRCLKKSHRTKIFASLSHTKSSRKMVPTGAIPRRIKSERMIYQHEEKNISASGDNGLAFGFAQHDPNYKMKITDQPQNDKNIDFLKESLCFRNLINSSTQRLRPKIESVSCSKFKEANSFQKVHSNVGYKSNTESSKNDKTVRKRVNEKENIEKQKGPKEILNPIEENSNITRARRIISKENSQKRNHTTVPNTNSNDSDDNFDMFD